MNKKLIRLTESDLHRIVKESVNSILKEYTGNFGYTDDNATSNRPTIGTPEYYRRNDRMQIGQEPIYNNARNWDDPNYNRKQSIGDSKPFNTNRGGQTPNNYVEESTNYNMNKKLIRLTEQDLHKIVKESVNKILNEWWDEDGDWVGGYEDANEENAQTNKNKRYYNRRKTYYNR